MITRSKLIAVMMVLCIASAHANDQRASAGVEANAFDTWINGLMAAQRNAASDAGTFPLVLIAQGNFHSAHHQSIIAEFLASHGYVVATVPSQTRISGQIVREEDALSAKVRGTLSILITLPRRVCEEEQCTSEVS